MWTLRSKTCRISTAVEARAPIRCSLCPGMMLLQQPRSGGITLCGLGAYHCIRWGHIVTSSGGIRCNPQQGDESVITKHRVNAFAGTDLDMILRANEIYTLKLLGIATSEVVLSTLLHARDADYRLFVLKDCCTDARIRRACVSDRKAVSPACHRSYRQRACGVAAIGIGLSRD